MSDPADLDALAGAQLFDGVARSDLSELARVMRRRSLAPSEVLWHQGADASGMAVVVEGRLAVSLQLPGGRSVELNVVGPGETLGELPLIDGGPHSATVRAAEAASVLFFDRAEFAPFVAREEPSAFAVKRRLTAVTVARLRRRLELLAESLGAGGEEPARAPMLEPAARPDDAYLERMAAFRAVDGAALREILDAGRFVHCPRGLTLEQEGDAAHALHLVINGTVERVLTRGDRRIRVGLAGPGQGFGYEGLIDGGPAPSTAVARERAVLLMLERDAFARAFGGSDRRSLCFLDIIGRDLAGWLRRANRPQAQLAVRPALREGVRS